MSQDLCLLYTSRLACPSKMQSVGPFVKSMRRFSEDHQITGMLVFDGEMFAQYVEGDGPSVQRLIEQITDDDRFVDTKTLMFDCVSAEREFANWSMAYPRHDSSTTLSDIAGKAGVDAVHFLKQMRSQLDMV